MPENKAPREFWIHTDCGEYSDKPSKHEEDKPFDIHVIEKSAYDELEKAGYDLIKRTDKEIRELKDKLIDLELSVVPRLQRERDRWEQVHTACSDILKEQLGTINKPLAVTAAFSLVVTERDSLKRELEQWKLKYDATLVSENAALKAELERMTKIADDNMAVADRFSAELEQAKQERDRLMDTPGGKRLYAQYHEILALKAELEQFKNPKDSYTKAVMENVAALLTHATRLADWIEANINYIENEEDVAVGLEVVRDFRKDFPK